MSFLSRFATRAVQRENERLYTRTDRLSADLRAVSRQLTAALERNTSHLNDLKACGEALEDFDRVADALQHVTAERDQTLARVVELEEQLTSLAADHLEVSGRLADLEEQRSSLAEAADYAAVLEAERESHADTRARLAELEGLLAATTLEER